MVLFKKYGIHIGVLGIGLFMGYLFFGESSIPLDSQNSASEKKRYHYSCAMHPEVNQPEMGSCPVCGMDLVEVQGETEYLDSNRFKLSENAIALANVETIAVGVGGVTNNTLKLSGKITTNEITNSVQTSIFDGRIEKLSANYLGAYIKKGQQIGEIYTPDLYQAQDQLLSTSSYKDGSHQKIYDAARNASGIWRMTDEQIDQVLKTGKPIVNFPLIADVSGTITDLYASEGSFYKQGDPLFKVSKLHTVWAVFEAYENQLPFLKVGEAVRISSKAFPGKVLEAKISVIEPILHETKRTALIRVNLNNKDYLLKPGMFIEGQIHLEGIIKQITVPESAVLWTGKRSIVYKKPNPDEPVFEMMEIVLGNHLGDSYVVMDGLFVGDEVVVNGAFTVDAAAQLQGKRSMMNSGESNLKVNKDYETIGFNPEVKKAFKHIVYEYIDLKDALVVSDSANIVSQAKMLSSKLDSLRLDLVSIDMESHLNTIKENSKLISTKSDMKTKRNNFLELSESLIKITAHFTDLDQPLYVQHCPMADNNRGGNWLSLTKEIRNPYFGDKMLSCGKVTGVLQ